MNLKQFLILPSLFIAFNAMAQSSFDKYSVEKKDFHFKVNELTEASFDEGFIKFKGSNLDMKKNTEFPIFIDLIEGRWYKFLAVGDPLAKKIELKLGLEGVGDVIVDKFKPDDVNEYWTSFSFICPRSGRYLLTFFQRAGRRNILGHISIMQKPFKTDHGNISFRH